MQVVFEALVYPFLFLTLYFEVFMILTFFDSEAKRRRNFTCASVFPFPTVSVVVPCFNEEATVRQTIHSLLELDYPGSNLSLIVVDDGSTDNTPLILKEFAAHPNVTLLRQKNAGKHVALNTGIAAGKSEFIACMDADSFVSKDALKESIAHFDNERIGAVTASLSVHNPKRIIERMQEAEYSLGIALRHILSVLNGIYVTPGPFTVYRRKTFEEVGPFRSAHQTEDMEIALRMQKAGWKIHNAPKAVVYTKAPDTLRGLMKQRVRWTTGFVRNCIDHRDLVGNPSHGILGLMVLPFNMLLIFFGITLFAVGVATIGGNIAEALARFAEVPFAFSLPSLDWFFAPFSAIAALSLLAGMIAFLLMYAGIRISKTRGRVISGFLWLAVLYGAVAPLWLARASVDVAFDIHRSWR